MLPNGALGMLVITNKPQLNENLLVITYSRIYRLLILKIYDSIYFHKIQLSLLQTYMNYLKSKLFSVP